METLNRIWSAVFSFIDEVISVFYPNRCAGCKEIIDNNRYICQACEKDIERIDYNKCCKICGLDKEDCNCKRYIYYFDGALAIYKNEGIAQKAMYSYKLGRKVAYVSFFAEDMAIAVKCGFKDIKFDTIIAIPTTIKSRIKYGFSPVDELCFALEELLDIKFSRNILKCKNTKKSQHNFGFSNRLENARKKFYCDGNLEGKTVLLVDDIKTSGATLSECARKLKFAGAEKVYCVTALATIVQKKKS